MALSPSLQQFKSSGVYRLEFDRSQIINIPAETIRLVIGFSKKGPFNTPVFVQDSIFFTQVFGDIDSVLERKGSFFHRTVLTCLDRGPVIVLNLLKLELTDTTNYGSVSTSVKESNSPIDSAPVSSFFNTDKFWFADPNALISSAENNQSSAATRLLNYANIGRKPISVITKKSDLLGFDITAKDWFSVGQIPAYMNENDYISDYLIDVVVVEGDFSNFTQLSIDPIFGSYFNTAGLKKNINDIFGNVKDGLTEFLSLPQVNVIGVYSGSIIPEFQDKNGNNIFIQDLVNIETSKTGLLMAINQEAFDDEPITLGGSPSRYISGDLIDTVGHSLEADSTISVLNFMSYYGTIIDDYNYLSAVGVTGSILSESIIIGATPGLTGSNALLEAGSATIQTGVGWTSVGATGYFDTITIYGPSSSQLPNLYTSYFSNQTDFINFSNSILVGKSFIKGDYLVNSGPTGNVNYISVKTKTLNTTNNTLKLTIDLIADPGVVGPTTISNGWYYIGGAGVTLGGGTSSLNIVRSNSWKFTDTGSVYAGQESNLYQDNLEGILTDGDKLSLDGSTAIGATFGFVQFIRTTTNDFAGSTFTGASVFNSEAPIYNKKINYSVISAYENDEFNPGEIETISATANYAFKTITGSVNETLEIDTLNTPNNPTNVIYLNNTSGGPRGLGGFTGKIKKGQYLVQNFGGTSTPTKIDPVKNNSRLTRVISVIEDTNPLSSLYGYIKVTTNDAIFIDTTSGSTVERYKDIRDVVNNYRFTSLNGYTLREAQMPNGTPARQSQILDVLYSTNLSTALEDREVITFRYIVDSFEGVIEPSSKFRLTKLAKNQQSSLAIVNMPSVKQFKDSTNPLFKFGSTASFDTRYIATGGNLDLAPSNIFSLPGIADGSNYSAFYGPNLIIRENGKNTSIPPSAHVSNLFIDKYNLDLPYSIVAGPRRGVITGKGLVGVEFNFDRKDLDSIEPFGYNAIVNKRGFGLTINANQTAQQTVKSALSQIHVRELIIYIQDGIEAILQNYRWEFNTAQNRLEIKTLADNFLSQILTDGGVFDFQNIMDTTNNTPEIIDNNIGILDTYIEPVRGLGVLVHRTTILKTGTISTGNFL